MKAVLHLVAMPWSNPHLPSPQLAALKAYVDMAIGGSFCSTTFSAFVNIVIEERNGRLKNYYTEYCAYGDYIYFLICFRRFLCKIGQFRRISLDKLLLSLNKSMEVNEKSVTLATLNILEVRTRRYVDEILSRSLRKKALNIIGFTLSYAQLYASIYCTRYLQEKYPEFRYLFVFGGETVSLPKVAGALKRFDIKGLAVIGEGENKLEQIIRSCLIMPLVDINELIPKLARTITGIYEIQSELLNLYELDLNILHNQVHRMEDLPPPLFEEYFTTIRRSLNNKRIRMEFISDISLTFEGSRGCYYGKCDFCDIRRSWDGWRVASPEWIAERVMKLTERYHCPKVWFMDCSCDKWASKYAEILIDNGIRLEGLMELRAHHPESFWTKLNLAGINTVQVGIEAFAPNLLAAMQKGTTVSQNIRVLKWLKELGIVSCSNIVTHHPKSTLEDIRITKRILSQIVHFERLDISNLAVLLGSPIDTTLTTQERRNLVERHTCCWPKSLLPYFVTNNEFDLPPRLEDKTLMKAWDEFITWEKDLHNQSSESATMTQTRYGPKQLVILDNRFNESRQLWLEGDSAVVYDTCHRGATFKDLHETTGYSETFLCNELDHLIKAKLLLEIDGWFLALALRPRDELICAHFRNASN